MTNSGLTNRLRQQSRKSGFAVGVAMAATILLCVAGFVVIYARVDPLTRDFIGSPATATVTRAAGEGASATQTDDNQNNAPPERTPTPEPPDDPTPTATSEEFVPTHLSNTSDSVNFRSGPGTDFGVITSIPAATPLRATGESGVAGDGLTWLEFELEDGTVGWIREIDSVPQG
jgi:cytoskeletal protein RodZ